MGSAQLSKISIWECRSSYTWSNVNVLGGSSGALGFFMLIVPVWTCGVEREGERFFKQSLKAAVYHILVSRAETRRAFNTGFDTVNLQMRDTFSQLWVEVDDDLAALVDLHAVAAHVAFERNT